MSAENLWQQLFDAVKTRFQRIYIVNGFQTDVGAHCFSWRDLNTSPIQDSEFPCIMVRDVKRETLREGRVINAHDHELTIEVYAGAKASGSSPPDNFARRILADLDQAIAEDIRWTISGVMLARDTIPGTDEIETVHAGDRTVGVKKTFTIQFRTRRFDPYNQ